MSSPYGGGRVVAGIQARMGSTRLPGKTLEDLAGKPLIQRVVERARAARCVDEVVVLTTVDPSDDPLARRLEELAMPCRRGPVDDVLQRYLDLVDEFDPRFVVRITGDCPLLEPSFIELQVAALAAGDADFTQVARRGTEAIEGNLGGHTAMSARALRSARATTDARNREHVATFFFLEHRADYVRVDVEVDDVYYREGIRLQVDEPPDLAFLRAIYERFAPEYDSLVPVARVIRWLDEHPEVLALNRDVGESAANRALRRLQRETDAAKETP